MQTNETGTVMRRLPIPLSTSGRLHNLGTHLLMMAQTTDVAYVRPSAAPDRGELAWQAMRESHLLGLVELIRMLDPRKKPRIATPRQRVVTIQLFTELWNHVAVEEHGDPDQIAKAIRCAEKLLTNCPVATACYVNEVVTVLARPEDTIELVRRAARNRLSMFDRDLLRGAMGHVLEFLGRSLNIAAVPMDSPTVATPPVALSPAQANPALQLTANQQSALERLRLMGELFFAAEQYKAVIRPKLFPLLAGPTGVGKSHLVSVAANQIGAEYYAITRGDFTVQHARYGIPTVYQLIELAAKHDRVVIGLEELDKYIGLFSGAEWSAALAADLWSSLDGRFPLADFFAADHPGVASMTARKMSTEELRRRIAHNLWFVGIGTWQHLFAAERKSSAIGFHGGQPASVSADSIAAANTIPLELLSRFNSDIIILKYPEPAETELLLDRFGIRALAQELGIKLDPEALDWQTGGMRALETLQTRLLLERLKRQRREQQD